MAQMTPKEARANIDPVLSDIARGYQNADMVGMTLFPEALVNQRGGQIISFGKEAFSVYNAVRTPGEDLLRIGFEFGSETFRLEQHALEAQVPIELMEEAEQVPGVDMATAAIAMVQNSTALWVEKTQADLATNPSKYDASHKLTTLSGSALFSEALNSNPLGAIAAGREAIRASVGRYPNVCVMGARVFAALSVHAQLLDRIRYTGRDNITEEVLARLFGVETLRSGGAIYQTDNAGTVADIWGTSLILAYVGKKGVKSLGTPSYGYTYRLNRHPLVEKPYYDGDKRSWVYQVVDELRPVISCQEAAYLINPAVAAP